MIILLLFIYFLITLFIFYQIKDIFHPILLNSIYWFLFVSIAVLYYQNYSWNNMTIIFFISLSLVQLFSFYLSKRISKGFRKDLINPIRKKLQPPILSRLQLGLYLGIILLGSLKTIIQFFQFGYTFSDINLLSILSISSQNSIDRYDGIQESFLFIVLNIFIYASSLISGFIFHYKIYRFKLLVVSLGFLPIFLSFVFTNGKAGFIATLFLWFSGFITSNYYFNKKPVPIKFRFVVFILIAFILFFVVLIFSFFLRIGEFDIRYLSFFYYKTLDYGFGGILVFDYWLTNIYDYTSPLSFGSNTFASIFSLVGLIVRNQGFYQFIPNFDSNIYTAFRGLIEDFSIIGIFYLYTLVFFFLSFMVFYIKNYNTKSSPFILTIISSSYFFILYSFIISPWIFSTFIFSFLLLYFYLRFKPKLSRYE
jgi:oligosaccharide repeat unit polymerase